MTKDLLTPYVETIDTIMKSIREHELPAIHEVGDHLAGVIGSGGRLRQTGA